MEDRQKCEKCREILTHYKKVLNITKEDIENALPPIFSKEWVIEGRGGNKVLNRHYKCRVCGWGIIVKEPFYTVTEIGKR